MEESVPISEPPHRVKRSAKTTVVPSDTQVYSSSLSSLQTPRDSILAHRLTNPFSLWC